MEHLISTFRRADSEPRLSKLAESEYRTDTVPSSESMIPFDSLVSTAGTDLILKKGGNGLDGVTMQKLLGEGVFL
jgi:hypothetical protein